MIDLAGKRALVTGGSRGIGAATARLLAAAGADVALTYHTNAASAEAVLAEVKAAGRRGFIHGGDLADPGVVDKLTAAVRSEFGGLDIYVANAGVWPADEIPLTSMDAGRWHQTVATNLDAVFLGTKAALGLMGDGGTVILVSSTAGQRGEAFHADYAATKGAIISLTKSLAIECAPRITVNCVAPGWVDTDMSATAYADGGRARIAAGIPLQRIASAEDIAGPIVFLASPLARHLTGEVINVNGGSVLCG